MTAAVEALLLNGTVGVGKTTAAEHVGRLLAQQGVPHAVVDLDGLRRAWPAPAGDPFHHALEVANLRDVAANHVRAGARRLVVAGVLEERAARADYERAVAAPLTVVRLRADVAGTEERLLARHRDDDDEARRWHVHRCGELHAVLETAALDDAVVDVDGLSREDVATAVLRAAGWTAVRP